MPYYKNNTDFVQPVTIDGKRFIIKPQTVIFVERELNLSIYSFLVPHEKLDVVQSLIPLKKKTSTPVIQSSEIVALKSRISELESSIQNLPKRAELTNMLNTIVEETPHIEVTEFNHLVDVINKVREDLEHISQDDMTKITNTLNEHSEQLAVVNKRLGILKTVLQNIESVIYETDDEEVVLEDDKNE